MLPIRSASGILRRYTVVDRVRWASTAAPPSKDKFKIVVLGGGASRTYDDLTQSLFRLSPPIVTVLSNQLNSARG